jgi:hypothetical protein
MVSVGRIAIIILGGLLLGTLTAEVIQMMPGIRRTAVIGATRDQSPPATPAVPGTTKESDMAPPPDIRPVVRVTPPRVTRVRRAQHSSKASLEAGKTTRMPETSVIDAAQGPSDTDNVHAVIDWLLMRSPSR